MAKDNNHQMPDEFITKTGLTERSANAKLVQWINEELAKSNIQLGNAEQETSGGDIKQPDIIIFDKPDSEKVLCLIELKRPEFDVFNYDELIRPAYEKASRRNAQYYAVSNLRTLVWFSTKRTAQGLSFSEQIVDTYELSNIKDINELRERVVELKIKEVLSRFLTALYEVNTGKTKEPKRPIDDILVSYLHDRIEYLSRFYQEIISKDFHSKKAFSDQLKRWFADQNWHFTGSEDDFLKAARQSANLLVNKILFYSLLQARLHLSQLELPKAIASAKTLKRFLQGYFDEVLEIDYETIFTTDFIDEAAFPENTTVINTIVDLVNYLRGYDLAKLGYDIVGRIFEKLIPKERRHELGQYFTPADVVDLILAFCMRKETDTILDPGCGAGTFLVRAYQQKKLIDARLSHAEILKTLYGFDIAKFPAHLATINLALNDVEVSENYPRIFQTDFFTQKPHMETQTQEGDRTKYPHPGLVQAVVGNPPYTRQEEIARITGDPDYKKDIIESALLNGEFNEIKLAKISKRAGIHAYFFVHGYKFLDEGGRFGFVVVNSWLDVGYGAGLQEFFLKHYKILAILESKVERWFADADVNTCIVILEKCADETTRMNNPARFVYIKKKLGELIPPAGEGREKELYRFKAIKKIVETVLAHDSGYENDDYRIYTVKQADLWQEGINDAGEFVGAKWGRYLRAPDIYFRIMEKCKDKLVPLKEIADVRFGIKTGANEFFYLTEDEIKEWGIEQEFWMHQGENEEWVPNYVIKSPQECKTIMVRPEDLKYRVLMCHKSKAELAGTNMLKYIKWGEKLGFHKRPTCSSRELWYDLGLRIPAIINTNYLINDVAKCFIGKVWASDNFQELRTDLHIAPFLNSTLFWLFQNLTGRTNFGGGLLKIQTYEFEKLPVLKKDLYSSELDILLKTISKRNVLSVYKEFSAKEPSEINLNKILPDRRLLDKFIMGNILSLSDEEQLEVYKAIIDLVSSRLGRAKSLQKKSKAKGGIDTEQLEENFLNQLGEDTVTKFLEMQMSDSESWEWIELPQEEPAKVHKDLYGWFLLCGKVKKAERVECRSALEAEYLLAWHEMGAIKAPVPKDIAKREDIAQPFLDLKASISEVIDDYTGGILDHRLRQSIVKLLWKKARGE